MPILWHVFSKEQWSFFHANVLQSPWHRNFGALWVTATWYSHPALWSQNITCIMQPALYRLHQPMPQYILIQLSEVYIFCICLKILEYDIICFVKNYSNYGFSNYILLCLSQTNNIPMIWNWYNFNTIFEPICQKGLFVIGNKINFWCIFKMFHSESGQLVYDFLFHVSSDIMSHILQSQELRLKNYWKCLEAWFLLIKSVRWTGPNSELFCIILFRWLMTSKWTEV